MVMRVTPTLSREQNLAAESDKKQEALKYLLVADGALVRARSSLGDEPGDGDEQVAHLIHTAGEAVRQAECQLWHRCDPWTLVAEGVW